MPKTVIVQSWLRNIDIRGPTHQLLLVPAMSRYWFAVSAFLATGVFLAILPAFAQTDKVDRQISAIPGQDKRFGVYVNPRPDCSSGPLPTIRLVTAPVHGTVKIKRGTFKGTNLKQCLAIEVPALVGYYHPATDFNGDDEFELEVKFTIRTQTQHFHVNVSTSSGQGERL